MKFLQRLRSVFLHFFLSPYASPLALAGVGVLAFGLIIPRLGFYWDDWTIVYLWKTHGDFWQFYQSDRPFMAWPDLAYLALAGGDPLRWQVLALLTRIAAAFAFWGCLDLLWPGERSRTLTAALLFSVYPIFLQQPMAITYKTHFLCLFLFLASNIFMLLALRKCRYIILLTALALLTSAAQLFTLEYFWGLELLRPLFLWRALAQPGRPGKEHARRVLVNWLPYLLLFLVVVAWRFFLLQLPEDRNAPTLLYSLLQSPLRASFKLLLMVLRDNLYLLFGSWGQVFQVQSLEAASPLMLASWGLAFAVGAGLWWFLSVVYRQEDAEPSPASQAWPRQAAWLGGLALLVGMIPVWMTDRQVTVGMYSDRFAIPALLGASLVVAGLLHAFLQKAAHRALVLAALLGLSVGFQFRIANDYRWDWTAQQRFYWQLYWRAPALKPGTSLLSDGGIFKYVTKYSLATAINSLYPVPAGSRQVPAWVFELDDTNVLALQEQGDLAAEMRTLSFAAPAEDSLVVRFDATDNSCLWLLSEADADYQHLSPASAEVLHLSNLDQVLPEPLDSSYPDPSIFGAEPPRGWCYYFEKADLARQLGDWEMVARLGDQAMAGGFSPNNLYEWIPFIEGYIHTGDWEQAQALTMQSFDRDQGNRLPLCSAWRRATRAGSLSAEGQARLESVQSALDCPAP